MHGCFVAFPIVIPVFYQENRLHKKSFQRKILKDNSLNVAINYNLFQVFDVTFFIKASLSHEMKHTSQIYARLQVRTRKSGITDFPSVTKIRFRTAQLLLSNKEHLSARHDVYAITTSLHEDAILYKRHQVAREHQVIRTQYY